MIEAVEEYLRADLAELDNPLRQDRGMLLRDLALLFRMYFAILSNPQIRK